MARAGIFVYGILSYLLFLAVFLYAIAFVGNLGVPVSVDVGNPAPFSTALAIDLLLLGLFAVQHSVMARQGFKRWWTRMVPPAAERSTYVLSASLVLLLLLVEWRPMPEPVWTVTAPVAQLAIGAVFWLGWMTVLFGSFMINHFDLFGLRQVYLNLIGRRYRPIEFQVGWLYRYVRHPLMFGFLLAFWATPRMTVGHLLFALGATGYIIVGTVLEERDLMRFHGDTYGEYRKRVWGFLPLGLLSPAPRTTRTARPDKSESPRSDLRAG
jgi:methanethiol S-methyltransferase